jgi:hypothetical protein
MSVNNINSSVQNQHPQIIVQATNKTAVTETTSNKSSSTTAARDTVTISAAGQALSNATNNSKIVGAYSESDYPQQLTEDDKKVIDAFPSDAPYNLIRNSVAFAVEAARKSGQLKGPLTLEALVGGTNNQLGLLADLAPDIQCKIPALALKKAMANGAGSIKNTSSDALAKILSDIFLSTEQAQSSGSQTSHTKQMILDYTT